LFGLYPKAIIMPSGSSGLKHLAFLASVQVSMIPDGTLRQADFEKRKAAYKDHQVVTYWWSFQLPCFSFF
jgi:hypothetical protein